MLTTDDDLSRAMTMIDVELSDKDQNRIKLYINNVKQAIMTLIGVQSNSDEDDAVFRKNLTTSSMKLLPLNITSFITREWIWLLKRD